ncbi:MAG: DUF4924 family protein [Prevotellaceae bacterium]|jgi:hypothetical protein|nr:DUF4924 family protein [Prevotellaceae bacterium]
MFIAQELKSKNIVEYLLYLWQIEDLIRAYRLDIDRINEEIILPYPVAKSEKKELYVWYENLIEMMRFEHIQEKGHLQINKNIVLNLEELHDTLMKSADATEYIATFYRILPVISHLRNKSNDSGSSDVEICFNFQYAYMLLKMKKTAISNDTMQAQKEIAAFLVLLAQKYNSHQKGELKSDKN